MTIMGYSLPHDGSIAIIKDGKLLHLIEGEKDSGKRYSGVDKKVFLKYFRRYNPHILATKYFRNLSGEEVDSAYEGTNEDFIEQHNSVISLLNYKNYQLHENYSLFDKEPASFENFTTGVYTFSTTHERAHIMSAYGMSPFPQGQECYSLCWEGITGRFHHINENLDILSFPTILESPGMFYAAAYFFAIPGTFEEKAHLIAESKAWAGKVMALTGFTLPRQELEDYYKPIIDEVLDHKMYDMYDERFIPAMMDAFKNTPIIGVGLESQVFKDFVYYLAQGIYNRFFEFAKTLKPGLPLLISGGCGLNCGWNTAFKQCGIFSDVFIPPVTNDSGQAIGQAIDAQYYYTGNAKIEWDPYVGEEFEVDVHPEWKAQVADYKVVAKYLMNGKVFAWVDGKYEMGPRALCHRSLIAAPFHKSIHIRLNQIKQREMYRPIAPVVTEEDVSQFFDWEEESPYMLHFMKVKSKGLEAITHADGSARIQTVKSTDKMHSLLKEFKDITGFPILCNTSLNFKGKGFINRMSDLIKYVSENDIDGFIVNNILYLKDN